MRQLLLLLSHRAGRIGLLSGLAIGFVISIAGSIIREVRNLTDTPACSQVSSVEMADTPVLLQVDVAEKRDAASHLKR